MPTDSIFNFAIPQAANYVGQNALNMGATGVMAQMPNMAGMATQNMLPNLMAETIGQGAQGALGNGITSFLDTMTPKAAGMFGKMGDFLGSDAFKNTVGAGTGIFGAINSYNQGQKANDVMNANLAMSQDAYKRDVEASEKSQLLNF